MIGNPPELVERFEKVHEDYAHLPAYERAKIIEKVKADYWQDDDAKLNKFSKPKKKSSYKPTENKHKQKPIDDQFLRLEYKRFFNNEELMIKIANKTALLLVLLKNIVDWNKNEKLNLYQEYFVKRKLLVASISRPRLAEMFGREKRRITEWAKALEIDGLLKIERIKCLDDDDQRKKYNVYILGEVKDDGSYTFYYEK